jgi:hypothetical protein
MNVVTHAYVTMIADTAITINSSVARIGEIPLLAFKKFGLDMKFTQTTLFSPSNDI